MIGSEVEVFSIGLGKKLVSFQDKSGTIWQICALPLGGYVRIKGENGENLGEKTQDFIEGNCQIHEIKENENNFEDKEPWKKILVVLAGPFFNFFLSFILIFFIFFSHGKPSFNLSDEYEIVINSVSENSLASQIGLEKGDKILEVNSEKIRNFEALHGNLKKSSEKQIDLKIFSLKEGGEKNLNFQLNKNAKLGVSLVPSGQISEDFKSLSLQGSISESLKYNVKLIEMTISGIFRLFKTPSEMKNLGGLVQIADFSGAAIQSGFINFLFFLALLSINLGVINLFPIPALDGGRFIFYFLDMIYIGRLIGPKMRAYSIGLSFFLLIALMIFANLNDIHKIFFNK
jgi:regulator of sigma E protease